MKILLALVKKELKQILRDPSSIVVAFVLPLISIVIYMYGINLDSVRVTMGIKNDDTNPEVTTLVKSFGHSKYVNSIIFDNEKDIESAVIRSKIKGAVIIQNDFSEYMKGVQSKIQRNWNPPDFGEDGQAVILFKISRLPNSFHGNRFFPETKCTIMGNKRTGNIRTALPYCGWAGKDMRTDRKARCDCICRRTIK